ncbi:carboxypeptidase-like regulatory domain-containing protein [Streptomyces chiangmaiensis]|uniref:carboxypeptidase-like regulatory domain-containing protein n=1 Tax=Streptomyces chiangmaiensis TaxID=766497 RepID=UPI00337FA88D
MGDVAAVSDPATGVAVYNSGWKVYGGTSAASPIIAGVYADAGTPAANTYPASYPYFNAAHLNDVTTGINGTCSPAYLCTAGPGYDGPTGLGTPNGLASFTTGPDGAVTGAVTDSTTHAPVYRATVKVGNTTTVTDLSGHYSLFLPVGTYSVTAEGYGFASKTISGVTVTDGSSVTEDFALAPASIFNNVRVTQDTNTDVGDIDGGGASLSAQGLAQTGVTPGFTIAHAGLAFTWPSTAGVTQTIGTHTYGTPDNVVASGQTIAVNNTSGNTLGFLVTATYGPAGGTATINYSDGSTQQFTLSSPDWFGGDGDIAITSAHQNRPDNMQYQAPGYVYYVGITLESNKTPVSVQLPDVSGLVTPGMPSLHIFAITRG